jgi:diguanylate cyclase (GGDEF)-like protein/PAS domain S-box-containing protein
MGEQKVVYALDVGLSPDPSFPWRQTLNPSYFFLSKSPLNRRLWLCVIGSIGALWLLQSFGFFGAVRVDSFILIVLVALAYFSPSHDEQPIVRPAGMPTIASPAEEQLFSRVFDSAAGMALVGQNGQWLRVNRSLCATLGYSDNELLERSFLDLAHPDDLGTTQGQIEKVLEGRITFYQTEQRLTHKLGHFVWTLMNISAICDSQGNASHLIFQFQDITDRKIEEERLVHNVFHDALTGLPNRVLFMDRLRLATERARRRKDQVFAVLFLDLDGFKAINDSMGHIMGDQLLIQISRRLKACLRTTDTIARLGGDEFTILLEDLTDERESLRIVERLQKELALPFKLGTSDVQVTASIGIASSNPGYERAEEILRDADMAMYRAKSAGKACYQLLDRERNAPPLDVANLGDDLDQAVAKGELVLHYQPIVSLETGRLHAFEALVRWHHPQLGLILPADFIPIAEERGSILKIGAWTMREACLQLKQWQERFPLQRSLAVTVNLSSKEFMQPHLIDQVIGILQDTGVNPSALKLEITEGVVMENIGTATVLLQQLRAVGIELGVDDFGTGYSSLSYLHRLPITWLKIDKSFVKGMVEKREHAEIVKTILALARSLGIRVVAEGVETLEQLVELRRLKCDAGQGFLFAKPAEVDTAETLLAFKNQWQTTIASLELHNKFEEPFEITTHGMSAPANRRALLRAV